MKALYKNWSSGLFWEESLSEVRSQISRDKSTLTQTRNSRGGGFFISIKNRLKQWYNNPNGNSDETMQWDKERKKNPVPIEKYTQTSVSCKSG